LRAFLTAVLVQPPSSRNLWDRLRGFASGVRPPRSAGAAGARAAVEPESK
jgi:hypothetical protein